jgi:XFP N-terminal domain
MPVDPNRVQAVFLTAVECRDLAARSALLDRECATDVELRRRSTTLKAFSIDMDNPEHIRILEEWMKSYRPDELFDARGQLNSELAELAPTGHRRMSDNPHANRGPLLHELKLTFRRWRRQFPAIFLGWLRGT